MPHYVIVTAGVVTEAFTTPFDPNFGRAEQADWIEVADERVTLGWMTADDGKTFAAPAMPTAPSVPPTVSGDAILSALSDAQAAKARPLDLIRIAPNSTVPATNPKLGRIAAAAGTTAQMLFSAAQGH